MPFYLKAEGCLRSCSLMASGDPRLKMEARMYAWGILASFKALMVMT